LTDEAFLLILSELSSRIYLREDIGGGKIARPDEDLLQRYENEKSTTLNGKQQICAYALIS
jgi:hypothetical protein